MTRRPCLALLSTLLACATTPPPAPAVDAVKTATTAQAAAPQEGSGAMPLAVWRDGPTLAARCQGGLARARDLRKDLATATGPAALATHNRLLFELDSTGNLASLMANVHPEAAVREAAEGCERDVKALIADIGLDRALYDAVARVDTSASDADTQFFQKKVLRDWRRSGVDKDDATRAELKSLSDELVKVAQDFTRNVRDARPTVSASAAELSGLPADFLAARKPGDDGKYVLGVDYPTLYPVISYAKSEAVRKALTVAGLNRGHPANEAVLDRMLALRARYASLLGFASWADYMAEDKMIGSGQAIATLIEDLAKLTRPRMAREQKELLAWKKKADKKAKAIEVWDRFYVVNQVRQQRFGFDAQVARPYFEYAQTLSGMFALYGELFGVEIRPLVGVPVWHPSVLAYELLEGGRVIGRFYLDMHPRADKYGHAAMFPLVTGVPGTSLPEATLVCNFPDPSAGRALMEHKDVTTLFHEFGHLVHHLLAQTSPWAIQDGVATEWDFVEAPSQLLEEWTWDVGVLQRFAKHVDTGEPIPAELVKKLRASSEFGKGMEEMRQIYFSAISYRLHDHPPVAGTLDTQIDELTRKYSPYPVVPATHMYASFGHLEGYSSMYYTYRWSLVLAKDIFTRFETAGLLDAATARAYRDEILRPGGRREARKLVEAFLGRAPNLEAYRRWIERN